MRRPSKGKTSPPSGDRPRQPQKRHWPRRDERRGARGAGHADDGAVILYGWHTVKAALDNPARRIRKLYATENAARRLAEDGVTLAVAPELVRPDAIAQRLA